MRTQVLRYTIWMWRWSRRYARAVRNVKFWSIITGKRYCIWEYRSNQQLHCRSFLCSRPINDLTSLTIEVYDPAIFVIGECWHFSWADDRMTNHKVIRCSAMGPQKEPRNALDPDLFSGPSFGAQVFFHFLRLWRGKKQRLIENQK